MCLRLISHRQRHTVHVGRRRPAAAADGALLARARVGAAAADPRRIAALAVLGQTCTSRKTKRKKGASQKKILLESWLESSRLHETFFPPR